MITLPNGKICMNEQEAIQWLLNNTPIPFQCSANYAAGTEIGLGTIVNPTPAKVKVGSIIFFADSKVSTVVGVTSNSFICSDQYNDLVDDIVYVSNVQLNASGHLIVTLSNGTNIDAGLIKQVSAFSINASQHLIVSYNDGTTSDLGAIFNGNINISGNITATGTISAPEILENAVSSLMEFYPVANVTMESVYGGIVKNGNKLTIVIAFKFNRSGVPGSNDLVNILIPASIGSKLYVAIGSITLARNNVYCADLDSGVDAEIVASLIKISNEQLKFTSGSLTELTLNKNYYIRAEYTFLLSDNILS